MHSLMFPNRDRLWWWLLGAWIALWLYNRAIGLVQDRAYLGVAAFFVALEVHELLHDIRDAVRPGTRAGVNL